MAVFLILSIFSLLSWWTILLVRTIKFSDITFIDGIVVGLSFFLICPMGLALLTGEMPALQLRTDPYRPYTDLMVTAMLFAGWLTVLIAKLASDRWFGGKTSPRIPFRKSDVALGVIAYAVLSVSSFVLLGRNQIGNWMENATLAFSTDLRAVLVGNAAIVLRGAVFGLLIVAVEYRHMTRNVAAFIGILIVISDVALTFNRITAAHFAVMLSIIYRDRLLLLTSLAVPLLPVLSSLSVKWSVIRAYILSQGLSIASVESSFLIGSQVSNATNNTFFDRLDGIFEGDNLVIFSYIVKNVPNSIAPLWGQTYLVRAISVFIPAVFWHDKPLTFGSQIGMRLQSVITLTLNSTLFGEPYGNFYLFWLPVMLMVLLGFQFAFLRAARLSGAAGAFGFFAGFSAWRFENSFSMISLVIFFAFVLAQLTIRSFGRTSAFVAEPTESSPAEPRVGRYPLRQIRGTSVRPK